MLLVHCLQGPGLIYEVADFRHAVSGIWRSPKANIPGLHPGKLILAFRDSFSFNGLVSIKQAKNQKQTQAGRLPKRGAAAGGNGIRPGITPKGLVYFGWNSGLITGRAGPSFGLAFLPLFWRWKKWKGIAKKRVDLIALQKSLSLLQG